jgi:polysaccharide pyruvyl transferase WcaK-like protein
MNIIISGPFGCGTLADELVLAGILRHLPPEKHSVTVFCANPKELAGRHKVKALAMTSPGGMATTALLWDALTQAHLLVVAGAGVLSEKGKIPARSWLGQFEHARRINIKTAVVGAGALPVADARERTRIQRLLHNFTDSISTRDDTAKRIIMEYGMSANRLTSCGDTTLALATVAHPGPEGETVFGVVLSTSVPSREEFAAVAKPIGANLKESLKTLLDTLLRQPGASVRLFHDDNDPATQLAAEFQKAAGGRVTTHSATLPVEELRKNISGCHAAFSMSLQGLILAAGCNVPSVGLRAEHGAGEFLAALGLGRFCIDAQGESFDAAAVAALLFEAANQHQALCGRIKPKIQTLAKKEAQNARMLTYLVPRRDRMPPRDEKDIKPKRKRAPRAKTGSDPWFTDERFN